MAPSNMDKPVRKRMPPKERIAQILDAARRLVLTNGLASLTMEKVGIESGASKALVYSYFPNITNLLQEGARTHPGQLQTFDRGYNLATHTH